MSGGAIRQAIEAEDGRFPRRIIPARHRYLLCHDHRALFQSRGVTKADAQHTLCFQCDRGLRNSTRESRVVPRLLASPLIVERRTCDSRTNHR
jgi:hypothetical protein